VKDAWRDTEREDREKMHAGRKEGKRERGEGGVSTAVTTISL
jgi:hypothetical protein